MTWPSQIGAIKLSMHLWNELDWNDIELSRYIKTSSKIIQSDESISRRKTQQSGGFQVGPRMQKKSPCLFTKMTNAYEIWFRSSFNLLYKRPSITNLMPLFQNTTQGPALTHNSMLAFKPEHNSLQILLPVFCLDTLQQNKIKNYSYISSPLTV